ncbi:hypothetical protein B0H16DRAFT_526272 [Mycena metata]|uniref:VPS37 C-terminal domain-containing protein n=1 Tax=Mycena metata TaxID=1033252 RepID=A0AAD7H8M1_9AGAR|nr:hypothetical protein B0H16DRAFT_526272 [Mycena metata]
MSTPLLSDFPELADLSREDLEDLLSDPVYFQAIFHSLDRVKAMYQSQAELGMANESIASAFRSRYTDYAPRRRRRLTMRRTWRQGGGTWRESSGRCISPQFLLMRLKHSKTAQDDASEALASAFVSSSSTDAGSGTGTPNGAGAGKEIDDFIREFKDLRKTYHKRVMWEDRWSSGRVNWRDD